MSEKVVIKQSTMVKPAEETPKRRLWLSRLDMYIRTPFAHTPTIYVYHPTSDNNGSDIPFFDATMLKKNLSKVLVPFYPMAGRLREDENGRHEIDCNGEGALFVEAETTQYSLSDLGDFKPTLELKKLVTPSCDYSKGLSSFPLLMVQLTRFKCGGVTLGFANHHHVADGWGHIHLINSWAKLTRGLELDPDLMPVHERRPYLAPHDPPQVKFQHVEFHPSRGLLSDASQISSNLDKKSITVSIFKLTKDQVNSLKEHANSTSSGGTYKLTTYEVVAGHIWRSVCKARGLADDQEVRVYIPTNGRNRLKNPALPQGYTGNVIFFAVCIAKSRDVTENPLCYAATKIHEMLERMKDEEYLRSAIDYLESYPNFDALVRGQHTANCPDMSINSWAKFDFYEADFGWGKPSFVGHAGILYEGQMFLGGTPNEEGGFSLFISLLNHHMPLFEKYFYEFGN